MIHISGTGMNQHFQGLFGPLVLKKSVGPHQFLRAPSLRALLLSTPWLQSICFPPNNISTLPDNRFVQVIKLTYSYTCISMHKMGESKFVLTSLPQTKQMDYSFSFWVWLMASTNFLRLIITMSTIYDHLLSLRKLHWNYLFYAHKLGSISLQQQNNYFTSGSCDDQIFKTCYIK